MRPPQARGWALSVNAIIRRASLVVSPHGVVTDGDEYEPCPQARERWLDVACGARLGSSHHAPDC